MELVLEKGSPADVSDRLDKEKRCYKLLDELGLEYWRCVADISSSSIIENNVGTVGNPSATYKADEIVKWKKCHGDASGGITIADPVQEKIAESIADVSAGKYNYETDAYNKKFPLKQLVLSAGSDKGTSTDKDASSKPAKESISSIENFENNQGDFIIPLIIFIVRLAVHVSNGLKTRIRPVVGRNGSGIYVRVHPKSWKKFKSRLKELSSRKRCQSIKLSLEEIKVYTRGWLNYYGIASMRRNIEDINGWLYHRIRMCIWKHMFHISRYMLFAKIKAC